MPLTTEAREILNFGPMPGGLDALSSENDLVIVIGSGRADHTWASLETPLAEQSAVTLTYELITLTGSAQQVQVSKYKATFPGLASGNISEVGLKTSDGRFLFIEDLTLDGFTEVTIMPDYATETVGVEIVLQRSLPKDPVLLLQGDGVSVYLLSLITSDGNTPFLDGNPNHSKVVYRESDQEVLTAFPGTVDVTHAVVESGAGFVDTVTILLSPDDEFYNPFPINQLKELRIGTNSVGNPGVLQVIWDEPQVRDPEMFWKVELPIQFTVTSTNGVS